MKAMSIVSTKGYRTVGIDSDIPWPAKEVIINFRGRRFHLLPETDTLAPMIRVETSPGFTRLDYDKMIFELLSALSWAEQRGATPTFGNWCTAPLNIGKGSNGGVIGEGHFDYLPDPHDPKAKLALALYREALTVNLIPYKFLSFFKVINVIRNKGTEQIHWIRDNLQHVTDKKAEVRIAAIQSIAPKVATYLYQSGRCAVAHAFDPKSVVNPDDPVDLIRLHEDLPVIRELARIAIERELDVKSERDFHSEHLYELEGFRVLLGDTLVAQIKAGEKMHSADIPIPRMLSLRVRDRDRIDLFESMDATVVYVRDGCVRIRLGSTCHRLVAFVTLDLEHERFVSDPLTDIHSHDDGTAAAAKMLLQCAQLHRWWFGGNGMIELWNPATEMQLARAPDYMSPINALFPHDEFEKMERELRARTNITDTPEGPKTD